MKKRTWYVVAIAGNGSEKIITDNLDEDSARQALQSFESNQLLEDLANGGSYALRATYFPPAALRTKYNRPIAPAFVDAHGRESLAWHLAEVEGHRAWLAFDELAWTAGP